MKSSKVLPSQERLKNCVWRDFREYIFSEAFAKELDERMQIK